MWVAAVCNTAEGLFKVFLTHRSQLNLKSASIKKNFARTVLLYLLIFGYNKKNYVLCGSAPSCLCGFFARPFNR